MAKYNYLLGFLPIALSANVQYVYAAKYMSVEEAQKTMFGNNTTFIDKKIVFTSEQKKQIKSVSKIREFKDQQEIWQVKDGNKNLGYFVVDEVYGKHEFIAYAVAIDTQGSVLGIDILEYRESYGGQIKEPWWRKQFVGKKITDNFTIDEDIKNISGATLSCKHIADGVKRVLTVYDLYIKDQKK